MSTLSYDPESLKVLAVSDSGFVFDPRTGHSYNMNASGLATLKALREGRSVRQVADVLREAFDGGTSIDDDVEAFLARLREHGLIAPRMASPAAEAR